MSTRSSARNLFPPLDIPELTIQRRSHVDRTLLNDFLMATNGNGDDVPPPEGGDLLVPDLRTMEELCQPTLNGRDESLFEARELYKLSIDRCPNHNMLPVTQIDTFYNGLTLRQRDTINAAAGGTFMKRRPEECYDLIKNMIAHHNDWDTSVQRRCVDDYQKKSKFRNSRNKSNVSQLKSSDGNSSYSSEIARLTHAVNQQTSTVTTAMTGILKQFQATPPPASVKAVEEICVTCGGAHLPLPSNTIANTNSDLKAITTRSGIILDGPSVPMPPPFINPKEDERVEETLTEPKLDEITIKQDNDEIQIHKFWQMFKQLHINITLVDALILIPKYQKMLKALLSKLENTPLNENCSAVILKKLPEKLGDPGKFLIPCGFSKLKCKALADLGTSINLMPLSVWKKLGLPELISTRMTLELANRAFCTPARIARDVFVLAGKFTFPADFVIVDYENDPRVPLILGRTFLQTARALIDVHGEEMILRESINMINIFNDSCEDFLKNLFVTNHLSGNPTSSSHTDLTSPKVINPLSGSTTSSVDHLLEDFADELALITFPSGNDDLPFDIESDLREIEYLLNHDPAKEIDSILKDSIDEYNLTDPNDNLFDTIPEMFTDEHSLDYSSPPLYDDFDDDLFELESNNEDAYNDPFDSKEDKIKESKLLIDELDLIRSSDFLPSPDYDSFLFEDFFRDTIQATPDKNVKKIFISNAFLILEDFDPPFYELSFHKEVLESKTLLSFSFENEEKVFKPEILTSKGVHISLLLELSHRGPKAFKVIKTLESPMEIFPCSHREDIRILDVSCLHFYPP
nr:reverse transcriptase domain-containing protein [Tanacetum cinerariifolium]